jgi:hypothetical protein
MPQARLRWVPAPEKINLSPFFSTIAYFDALLSRL